MAGDGSHRQALEKKKMHKMNPRRRLKLKHKLPLQSDQPLSDEEKYRRSEQKKRRVRPDSSSSSSSGTAFAGLLRVPRRS